MLKITNRYTRKLLQNDLATEHVAYPYLFSTIQRKLLNKTFQPVGEAFRTPF